ncbi:hypothetical protein ACHAW6_005251 [Cyclotella cf. meneghiniana]
MQGHLESPRLWEKHIYRILCNLTFLPMVHEPCLYCGVVDGKRVIFKWQVNDFAIATTSARIANIIFDAIDSQLSMPIKRQGLLNLYNGIDILQSWWFIKLSMKTYLTKMLAPYLVTWLKIPTTAMPTPLGSSESFVKRLYEAVGDPDPKVQAALEKEMGIKYCKAIGELIWPMVTCGPDLSQAVPVPVRLRRITKLLRVFSVFVTATIDDGIHFWRVEPRLDLLDDPLSAISSSPYNIRMLPRPLDDPLVPHGYMDSSWADCLLTRQSFGGVCMHLAGGLATYKSRLWPTVALSSTEAEYMMANDADRISLYMRSILWDLGIPQEAATILYEDNDGATAMANAGKPTPCSHHIDIKYYALQEWCEHDLLVLNRVDTSINMADHFTKPLPRILCHRHCDFYMGFVPPTYSPRYLEVARIYSDPNNPFNGFYATGVADLLDDEGHNMGTAMAARTVALWDVIFKNYFNMVHSVYVSIRWLIKTWGGYIC